MYFDSLVQKTKFLKPYLYTMVRKCILKKSKKVHWNKDFCLGSKVFIQLPYISFSGKAVFPKSIVFPLDPAMDLKLVLWIQSFYCGSTGFYSGSKVINQDPK